MIIFVHSTLTYLHVIVTSEVVFIHGLCTPPEYQGCNKTKFHFTFTKNFKEALRRVRRFFWAGQLNLNLTMQTDMPSTLLVYYTRALDKGWTGTDILALMMKRMMDGTLSRIPNVQIVCKLCENSAICKMFEVIGRLTIERWFSFWNTHADWQTYLTFVLLDLIIRA